MRWNILKSLVPVALALLVSCKEQAGSRRETTYRVMTVEAGDRVLESRYAATLRGCQTVEVRPQVSGMITEIRIREGAVVRKGQILFVIDQVPYKAALETAVANVKSAEAKVATARLNVESNEELFKENVVSEYDLRMAENALAEAQSALALARAQETNARNNLSYTEVKSPVNGITSMIPYRVGALVASTISDPLVTVSDDSEIHAYFSIAENQVLNMTQAYGSLDKALQDMPKVNLIMSNGEIYSRKGTVDAISGTISETTGAVSLRATFSNPEHLLREGGSGTVVVPVVRKNCIVIPQAATYELQERIYVYKIVDGKTKSARIRVFPQHNGTEYVVEEGLEAGEQIIAEGAGLVREGVEVKVSPDKEGK